MAVLSTIASIVMIAVSLATAGATVHQVSLGALNQNVRNDINKLVTKINSEISAGRLKSSKLLSLLNGKNQHALMTYLYNNPVISKSVQELNNEATLLNDYQTELQNIETEIQTHLNQLQSLGYSQSHGGVTKEKAKANEIEGKIREAQTRYDAKVKEIGELNLGSTNRVVKPSVSDLDAATQNLKGGLV